VIRTLFRPAEGKGQFGLTVAEAASRRNEPGVLVWVDFEGESIEVCEPILRNTFGFHPLAVDDALRETHISKIDDWGDYLYIVLHEVSYRAEGADLSHTEVDCFLGPGYLVTHHDHPVESVSRIWGRCQREERPLQGGADHLLYELTDEMATQLMPVAEAMDEELDSIEDQILGQARQEVLERIFSLKRAMLRLRRVIAPQREVLNKLARDEYRAVDAKDRVYFRDVYDHLVRLHDINESLRDQASSALETYLSAVNNRLNEVLKTLTVITVLFMPATFVTSFFGMNILLASRPVDVSPGTVLFVVGMAAMVMAPLGIYLWVRRRGWI
jgi:magnesium transporter